ncbi:GIY-YIG nuclease family protein [Roseomonas eburnea]|uniref:GIY-YIG nuclease family protein n=1 Tax=Neoroseomonas eburnea TaxID=1346889 RepID=A0A9X9XHS5_9PROT|nr:GIY-YIG nuclease family protein [Neoroseomonas eburnea]MBR0683261.1 GIY-YIG nuclease family protein [Neoroseomonas eburnea]
MSYLSPRNSPLASVFAGLPPPPVPLDQVWGDDGVDYRYRFAVYDIHAYPSAANAVYIFAARQGLTYIPIYVGRAESLSRRLSSHERRDEAIRRGARYLLVHVPAVTDLIGYAEAERRLIRHYAPTLNEQHNLLPALLAR